MNIYPMSNLYLSHEHLDEVIADYQKALAEYWKAKENLGQMQYEADEYEANLYAHGLIYNPKEKSQGTNDTSRKLYARECMVVQLSRVQDATVEMQKAEAKYEAMRKELESFRLHLQLQGLILRERELMPTGPVITHVEPFVRDVGTATFAEMAPFDETDYETTLRKIREMIAQDGLAPDEEE
jgi:hypothetical protein